jgi:putative DNA methylase
VLREADGVQHNLHAFVVMPNHVHILVTPLVPMAKLTQRIKGRSARLANEILGRTGQPFWQDESFDHWVRNSVQFEKIRSYIENNPVKAGLVAESCLWPYSSAFGTQAEACATG